MQTRTGPRVSSSGRGVVYLVVYQQVRPGVRVGEPRDGLGGERVLAELGVLPAAALDAAEAAAALALRRVRLDHRGRCHVRPSSGRGVGRWGGTMHRPDQARQQSAAVGGSVRVSTGRRGC